MKYINPVLILFCFLSICAHVFASVDIKSIKKGLASSEPLEQGGAIIELFNLMNTAGDERNKSEEIFLNLSKDRDAVGAITGIIDERLVCWYMEEDEKIVSESIRMYSPLFYILYLSDDKSARGILVKSLFFLSDDFIAGFVPDNAGFMNILFKKYGILKDGLCCLYPGKDFVAERLRKEMMLHMLSVFERMPDRKGEGDDGRKKEFVIDCLQCNNGYLVKAKAVDLAGRLIKNGDRGLIKIIKRAAKEDSFYVHRVTGYRNGIPVYNRTQLRYPVREKAQNLLFEIKKK